MITLGMDPSITGFGWCVHDSNATGPARVVAKGVFKTDAKAIFVTRYMWLRQSIIDLLGRFPQVEATGVESPPFGELWSEGLYGLFLYVNEALYTLRKDVVYWDPVTVKMLVKVDPSVRKGAMFKQDMVEAAKEDTDIRKAWNHNEADAYHIARFAARFWGLYRGDILDTDLTPAEAHAFLKIHTFSRGKHAGETKLDGALFKENKRFFRYSRIPVGRESNG